MYVVVNIAVSHNYVQKILVFPQFPRNCILYQCPNTSKTTIGLRNQKNLKSCMPKVLLRCYHTVLQRQRGGLRFVFFSIITEANNSAANSKTTQCHWLQSHCWIAHICMRSLLYKKKVSLCIRRDIISCVFLRFFPPHHQLHDSNIQP